MNNETFTNLQEKFKASNKALAEFLREEQIPISKYYNLRRKFEGPRRVRRKKELVEDSAFSRKGLIQLTILYPNGVQALVPIEMNIDWIRALILV